MLDQPIDTTVATPTDQQAAAAQKPADLPVLVEQDLLVEDVSIDGMCGVY